METPIVIERRKLFEQVAAHLERQILSGMLKPGDRLATERELQVQFGVGRPSIREALITLQRTGLIEIANGAPARVAMPTATGVVAGMAPAVSQMLTTDEGQHHLQKVRLFFEAGLARQAASEATPEDIESLTTALADNRAAIGDREQFIATDVAFHYVLEQVTGNPVFTALHDALSAWLRQQRTVSLAVPGQEEIAYQAHRAIFDAVVARNPEAADKAMRDHLTDIEGAYWAAKRSV